MTEENNRYKEAQHQFDDHNNSRTRYKLKEGNEWNPLKRFPRNHPCFCGSEVKHKKCCFPFVGEFTTTQAAAQVEAQWSKLLSGESTINIRPANTNQGEARGKRENDLEK